MARVWHYDGKSALRHEGELVTSGDGFEIQAPGLFPTRHLWTELVYRGEKPEGAIYGLKGQDGWQIGIYDPIPPELFSRLPPPQKYGGFIDRIGILPASLAFLVVSGLAIFGVVSLPEYLAPLVPMSWEKKLGDAMVGDMGGRFCNGPGSDDALKTLAARIEPEGEKADIRIANIAMVNAFALPGGKVVIFKGLLKEAKSPDELAGVLGHEIGHVRKRHVMQSLLRQLGLGILLSGSNSNATGYFDALVSSSYSRGAEEEADKFSMERMDQGRISPLATAGFFGRLAEEEKKLGDAAAALGYLSSHPVSAKREKAFRQSHKPGAPYSPALTQAQWQAILDSCAKDPDVNKDDSFLF